MLLRAEKEDLAVLVPLAPAAEPRQGVLTQAQYDAVMSAAGGWRGIVDTEQLKKDLEAARGSDRPPVEF